MAKELLSWDVEVSASVGASRVSVLCSACVDEAELSDDLDDVDCVDDMDDEDVADEVDVDEVDVALLSSCAVAGLSHVVVFEGRCQ